jgi:hypothetical protein
MTMAPKDVGATTGPALDEDLELEQSDTDAVAGGRTSHTKKDGKANWRDSKCLAD